MKKAMTQPMTKPEIDLALAPHLTRKVRRMLLRALDEADLAVIRK